MAQDDRERVEDFALGAVRVLATGRAGAGDGAMSSRAALYREMGIDFDAAMEEIREKDADPEFHASSPNMLTGYVVPQMQRVGLVTDRLAPQYRELGFEV
tara:strand:- start:198 stop:497 length:300 start_codon:yes stop_codon:yes gene_type:complete